MGSAVLKDEISGDTGKQTLSPALTSGTRADGGRPIRYASGANPRRKVFSVTVRGSMNWSR
jgi:hypothetical protein